MKHNSKYDYPIKIETKLNEFEKYLRKQRLAVSTIRQLRNYAGIYLEWLEEENEVLAKVDYNGFMNFIFQLKKENGLNKVRRIIVAVRHYYSSLEIENNPATGLKIKGQRKAVLNHLVSYEKLIKLYEEYEVGSAVENEISDRSKRNKVLLGILIYQAVTTGSLQQLQVRHVRLEKGEIYIPSYRNTNSRTLKLATTQLLDLQNYLQIIRPRMLLNIHAKRGGRKPGIIKMELLKQQLFFSENGSTSIKNSLQHLFSNIKKLDPKITSGKIIRATVIAEWLKTKDLRIVQYMAGHKWVSSTEKYNEKNLQSLQEALNKHHPLQ